MTVEPFADQALRDTTRRRFISERDLGLGDSVARAELHPGWLGHRNEMVSPGPLWGKDTHMGGRITPAVRAMEQAGLAFQLLEYEYDPSTDAIGLQAARALGRPAPTVFKTLVVALDSGELICAIIPSDARLNLKTIASAAGAKMANLSDPKKAERATGYVVGGISPLGQRRRLRTFIDASAPALDEIVVNGGRRGLQIVVRPADLILATSAVTVSLRC
jgi:Cys-tRNA(Pro)/Cys-tRNA(Cys) deacylase